MSVAEIEAAEISLDAPTGGLWREASRRLIRNPTAIAAGFRISRYQASLQSPPVGDSSEISAASSSATLMST